MRKQLILPALVLPMLTGGCLAKTAWDVATLPVKATGQAVDWATTSQDESDRNYGRKVRKQEAEEGRRRREEERRARREAERDD
ncbi:hypothetical protein [Sphingomonas japonica]|uniref:Lipoprotein n=1 Tax=Sphingomonas japonica TaxID=511662 RepID=A0ABX0U0L3_9SPHN|nr:hypothetical protein [Sphingomonas japonica]NIJ24119.1 hypothetical protein [Sphingomonas japonica]